LTDKGASHSFRFEAISASNATNPNIVETHKRAFGGVNFAAILSESGKVAVDASQSFSLFA